jgi:hypothetical protein
LPSAGAKVFEVRISGFRFLSGFFRVSGFPGFKVSGFRGFKGLEFL